MIKYKGGYKYQLTKPYSFYLKKPIPNEVDHEYFAIQANGFMGIKSSYAWDGASGPAIDTKNFMRGSLIHDALYQAIREGKLPQSFKQTADEILKDICIEDGMSKIRATWVYYGVRMGGGPAIKNDRKEISAP